MSDFLPAIGVGIALFVSTNIDDVFLLAVFFADAHLRAQSIVFGQFLGITALTAVSAAAAAAALVIPAEWTALVGIVPLALGVWKLWELRSRGRAVDADERVRQREQAAEARVGSQALAVAAVTVANGGDNLAVYIPVFAKDVGAIPVYAAIFTVMTALWCAMGYGLVNNPIAGESIGRYGHVALPVVLIALGVWILKDAVVP